MTVNQLVYRLETFLNSKKTRRGSRGRKSNIKRKERFLSASQEQQEKWRKSAKKAKNKKLNQAEERSNAGQLSVCLIWKLKTTVNSVLKPQNQFFQNCVSRIFCIYLSALNQHGLIESNSVQWELQKFRVIRKKNSSVEFSYP